MNNLETSKRLLEILDEATIESGSSFDNEEIELRKSNDQPQASDESDSSGESSTDEEIEDRRDTLRMSVISTMIYNSL